MTTKRKVKREIQKRLDLIIDGLGEDCFNVYSTIELVNIVLSYVGEPKDDN